jgi:hypothetical protein
MSETAAKELRAVKRAAAKKGNAEAELRAAMNAARDAGATLEEIGQACNLTRQGVRYLLLRNAEGEA